MKRTIAITLRTIIRIVTLVTIATFFIVCAVALIYKPIYSVTYNNEFIGYSQSKIKLQKRINQYIEKGEGENVAFVQIDSLPEYDLCLLKKGNATNDDEIFEMVKKTGVTYYKYYAITDNEEEKAYVSSNSEAEDIINQLKDKNSANKSELGFVEKYSTELTDFTAVATVVDDLYEKPKPVRTYTYYSDEYYSGINEGEKIEIAVGLIRPVSGIITSRYGYRWGSVHTGLDIAASSGTPIMAAASGTVVVTNYSNVSYGNSIRISHGSGVETLYAHLTSIYVEEGQWVSQGEVIGTMGSTGNSTGPHLHLEVRINGVTQNPQNYLY